MFGCFKLIDIFLQNWGLKLSLTMKNDKTFSRHVKFDTKQYCLIYKFDIKFFTCSVLRSPKDIPPDISTVAVSGTRYTFQPRFSKYVASLACAVVLPPHGPPVNTS